jgi:hypothetical protein
MCESLYAIIGVPLKRMLLLCIFLCIGDWQSTLYLSSSFTMVINWALYDVFCLRYRMHRRHYLYGS